MGPTCSIIYENEPIEKGIMLRPPRKMGVSFLSLNQLSISILLGLMITAGCLGIGYYFMQQGSDDATVRTVVFITLLFSNIFLTLVNRSFTYAVFTTLSYKNNLVPLIIGITLIFIAALIYVPAVRNLFMLNTLSIKMLLSCIGVALMATLWIDILKVISRKKVGRE